MYEDQTKEVILDRMLSKIPSTIDKRQGSITADMLSPAAIESALLYAELNNVLNFGFADTTYGEYLDRRVTEVGITRKASVTSVGKLTFSGTDGTVIPVGTITTTEGDEPLQFTTIVQGTITAGSVTVDAKAVQGGSVGNVSAGAIQLVSGVLSGLITVTNNEAFSGGLDTESDEDLLLRYYDRMQNKGAAGSKSDYKNWALEVTNIGDARVFPIWNGPGTVKVVLLGTNRRTPSAALVQEVANHIEAVRPIGASVTVVGATEIAITVSVKLTLKAGATLSNAVAQITANATEYLTSLAFTDLVVRYSKIADSVLNASDVLDYEDLRVNGSTSNLQLAEDQIPVFGTIITL